MSELPPPPASEPGEPGAGWTPPPLPPPSQDVAGRPAEPFGETPGAGQAGFGPPPVGPPTGPVVTVQPPDGGGRRPWWKGPAGIVAATVVVIGLVAGGIALTRSDDEKITVDTERPRRTFDTQPERTDPATTGTADTTEVVETAEPTPTDATTPTEDTDPEFTLPPLTDPPVTEGPTPTTAVAPPSSAAAVGGEVTVTSDGNAVRLTLLQIVDQAPFRKFLEPDAGNKYVAVQVRLVNDGPDAFNDVVSFGSTLIDDQNQQFDSSFSGTPLGPELSSVTVRPGDVRSGWITFEVPESATAQQLQIEPFFTGDTARWDLTADPVTPADAPAVLSADVAFNAPGTLTLGDGNSITVTALQLVDPAEPEFGEMDEGTRLIAVQVSFTNNGPGAFSDSPDGIISVIDTAGQQSSSTFSGTKAGPGFSGSVDLAAGETRVGFIAIEIPADTQPLKVQVASFGSETLELALA